MEKLELGSKPNSPLELVVIVRDKDGNPRLNQDGSIMKKSFQTDSPYKLYEFYQRFKGKPRRKTHKGSGTAPLPNAQQANQLLKSVAQYAEQKQQVRDKQQKTTE